jgi:hypothetical protein
VVKGIVAVSLTLLVALGCLLGAELTARSLAGSHQDAASLLLKPRAERCRRRCKSRLTTWIGRSRRGAEPDRPPEVLHGVRPGEYLRTLTALRPLGVLRGWKTTGSPCKGRARDVCEVDDIAVSILAADEAVAACAVVGLNRALHITV